MVIFSLTGNGPLVVSVSPKFNLYITIYPLWKNLLVQIRQWLVGPRQAEKAGWLGSLKPIFWPKLDSGAGFPTMPR